MSRRHWNVSVVRLRAAAGQTEYGTPGPVDWDTPDVLPITRARLIPEATGPLEADPTRVAAEEAWTLFHRDRLLDVDKGDRIVHRGDTFTVQGFPAPYDGLLAVRLTRRVG